MYYLALKEYALELEKDRDHWFAYSDWGIDVNLARGTFSWKGGNTINFPMTPVCHEQSLSLRERQYLIQYHSETN